MRTRTWTPGCPRGERLHAVLQPISRHGTAISVRIPARRTFGLDELVAAGTMPPELAGLLTDVVASSLAMLICGGTGSGKTTLLAALLALVPGDQRLVIVEDSTELMPDHPHVVHLEARPPNAEGVGEITVRTLVRQALRMRPDRLVVGEVRGAEVVDLLAACNTGHEGGCGTVHANGAAQVPARMEALGVAAGLDRQAVHSQLAAAIDVVVAMRRGPDGSRVVDSVSVLTVDSSALVRCLPAVTCPGDGRIVLGPGADLLDDLLTTRLPGAPGATMTTSAVAAGALIAAAVLVWGGVPGRVLLRVRGIDAGRRRRETGRLHDRLSHAPPFGVGLVLVSGGVLAGAAFLGVAGDARVGALRGGLLAGTLVAGWTAVRAPPRGDCPDRAVAALAGGV